MSDVDSRDTGLEVTEHPGPSGEQEGEFLLRWVRCSLAQLRRAEETINRLNVFPIPDADTGTNMVTTLNAALTQAERAGVSTTAEIAAALAAGAVRGARGNSGMALSQILRSVASTSAVGSWDPQAVTSCLTVAVDFVRGAIADPVPGTIISVLEAAAEAAQATDQRSIVHVVEAAVAAARLALSQTSQFLDSLKRAGVVDAGGCGLVILLEALLTELEGEESDTVYHVEASQQSDRKQPPGQHTESGSLLEVMFTVQGYGDELGRTLEGLGTSLVIAPFTDPYTARFHIHTDRPGDVLHAAYSTAQVSDLRVEALPASRHILIAIVPPGKLTEVFEESGAFVVPPGEDAPEQISQILRSQDAEALVQSNGLLTRLQLHRICTSHPNLRVLPTRSLVAGIAAQAVFDPYQPLNLTALSMADTAATMVTCTIDASGNGYILQGACAVDQVYTQLNQAITGAYQRLTVAREVPPELLTVVVSPEVSEVADFTYTTDTPVGFERADIIKYVSDNGGHCVQIGVE